MGSLACGDSTKSGNRRVLGENDRVFCRARVKPGGNGSIDTKYTWM